MSSQKVNKSITRVKYINFFLSDNNEISTFFDALIIIEMEKLQSLLKFGVCIMATASLLSSCEYEVVEVDLTPITEEISFSEKIIPIFNASCNFSGCHSAGAVPPDLSPAGAYNSLMNRNEIDTANPTNSNLYKVITTGSMKNYSNADQAKLILAWIKQGAKDN